MPNKNLNNGRASHKGLFFVIVAVLLVAVAAGALFLGLTSWENSQSEQIVAAKVEEVQVDEDPYYYYQGKPYKLKENVVTTLVMGLDTFQETIDESDEENADSKIPTYRNHQQADFITLIVTDKDTNTSRMLQLNRDTMANVQTLSITGDVTGTTYTQLALSHTYGSGNRDSCKNVAKSVSNLLGGIQIDHYISLTMDAVATINDAIGGVTVTVLDDFSNTDPTLVQGEEVTLFGDHALMYVRARSSMEDSTNLARMERQRQYLEAFYNKLANEVELDSELMYNLVFKVSPYMVSDLSVNTLSDVLTTALETSTGEIETIDGEAVQGKVYMEFYPDEDSLQEKILDLFYTSAVR